jgi:putative stress-induced transcription regulator
VNTLDVLPATEEFDDPTDLASWLAEYRLVPNPHTLTDEDLARAKSLREALRAMLLTNASLSLHGGRQGVQRGRCVPTHCVLAWGDFRCPRDSVLP